MSNKKPDSTLSRIAAPSLPSSPRSTNPAPAETASLDTTTIGLSRLLLLRIKRYALDIQSRHAARVTQRALAERFIAEYLDGERPVITLPEEEPILQSSINTLALDRALLLRLKHHTLDLRSELGRSVTQREMAEAIIGAALDQLETAQTHP